VQARRATIKQHDVEGQPQSAEAAILAAAAATGAEVERIDAPIEEKPAFKRERTRAVRTRPARSARPLIGFAVAGTLLLAAGLGLYWVLGTGHGDPATAPVLTADATPVKQPPVVTEADSTTARSPVLDQIDGVTAPLGTESLVPTNGSDTDMVASVEDEDASESGLANRKVRTVTVRPDGTIISSEDSVAGAEPLPVERPNVPEVPGAAIEPSDLLATADTAPEAAAAPEVSAASANPANPDPIAAVIGGADEAGTPAREETSVDVANVAPTPALAEGATPTPADVVAPAPMPRPTDRSTLNGQPSNSVTAEVTAPQPTLGTALTAGGQAIDLLAQPNPVAAEPASTAVAYVQLSSQRTEADARASAGNIAARYGTVMGGAQLEVHRADLGARGIYYRVMMPAKSRAQALDVCGRIKSAGGDCFVP
jgi:hypothetical protein